MYIALQNCAPYPPPHPPLISFTCLCWIGIAFNLIVHANNDNKNAFYSSQFKQQNCKRCYALIAHAVVDFWVTDTGLMVTPKHKNIHTQEVSSVSLLSFFFSFQILIFPFIPSCPRRPEYISSSTHFSLVGGLYGASCLMRPFCPFVLGVSGIWSLWIIPSVCFCLGKKVRQRKGTKRIKGDESTDISWRLLSKWSIVLFELIHLITPPLPPISLQPYISPPPHTVIPLFCACMLPNPSLVLILFSHLIIISQFASFP